MIQHLRLQTSLMLHHDAITGTKMALNAYKTTY